MLPVEGGGATDANIYGKQCDTYLNLILFSKPARNYRQTTIRFYVHKVTQSCIISDYSVMQKFRESNARKQRERIERTAGKHSAGSHHFQQDQPPATNTDANTDEVNTTAQENEDKSLVDSQPQRQEQQDVQPKTEQDGEDSGGSFTLLLFASAQSYANDTESLSLPAPMTLRQLFRELERRYPGIGQKILRSSGISINLEYVDFEWDDNDDDDPGEEAQHEVITIKEGDEVGIIPPVSSG